MPELKELLAAEAATFDIQQPPVSVIRRRRQRRVATRAGGALAAFTLLASGALLLAPGTDLLTQQEDQAATDPPATAEPEAVSGPSQSEADARRDGVLPEVAALPFAERIRVVASEESPEGVWAVTRMPGGPGVLGNADGRYGIDWVQRHEYGELLLLDATGTRILRALPLPGVPPQAVLVGGDFVYCARQGDGGLPNSMLCRADRDDFHALVRVFTSSSPDSSVPAERPNWLHEPAPPKVSFDSVTACPEGFCVSGQDGPVPFHPATLELPYDRTRWSDTAASCRHITAAVAAQARVTGPGDPDWETVEAEMYLAWEVGRGGNDPHFIRNLISPGSLLDNDTQTLGDATHRLAGLCGMRADGLRAPAPEQLDRTDEFGAVMGTARLPDGTLRVEVNRVNWLSGEEAKAAAAADGTDAGDYYVQDDNPTTRTYDVSPTARVWGSIRLTGVPELSERSVADWLRFLSSGSRAMNGQNVAEQVRGTYFHFQVEDDVIVGIEEQYRP